MSYFDHPEHVADYIKICAGLSNDTLINILKQHLPFDSQVLELGSGPGNDAALLQPYYRLIMSDASQAFVTHLQQRFIDADCRLIDASHVQLEQPVDCIFSNKVLHHLTPAQLAASIQQQVTQLNDNGLLAHSFWIGNNNFEYQGETHYYYRHEALLALIEPYVDIIESHSYDEFAHEDSLFLLGQKRS